MTNDNFHYIGLPGLTWEIPGNLRGGGNPEVGGVWGVVGPQHNTRP